MEDYSGIFNKFAAPYLDKFNVVDGDRSKLIEDEQEISALWGLCADMFMDGFLDFFVWYEYDGYVIPMRAIKRVGCKKLYKLLEKVYKKVFDKFQNDKRITSYGDIEQYLTERDGEILEDAFDKFDEVYGEELCKAAYKFYSEKIERTV